MMRRSLIDRDDPAILHEAGIVWLEPAGSHPYLREAVVTDFSARSRPRLAPGNRLVGYGTTRRGRPGDLHRRRYWWVKPSDRSMDPTGVYATTCPLGAVDPSSIQVARPSLAARP